MDKHHSSSLYSLPSRGRELFHYFAIIFKGLLTLVAMTVILTFCAGFYSFHSERMKLYPEKLRLHREARVYLTSDTCKNSELRVRVTHFEACLQVERMILVDPWEEATNMAFYSTLGCSGGGLCARVYEDVQCLVKVFVVVTVVLGVYLA